MLFRIGFVFTLCFESVSSKGGRLNLPKITENSKCNTRKFCIPALNPIPVEKSAILHLYWGRRYFDRKDTDPQRDGAILESFKIRIPKILDLSIQKKFNLKFRDYLAKS